MWAAYVRAPNQSKLISRGSLWGRCGRFTYFKGRRSVLTTYLHRHNLCGGRATVTPFCGLACLFIKPCTKDSKDKNGKRCITTAKNCTRQWEQRSLESIKRQGRALWAMRTAKDREEQFYDPTHQKDIQARPQPDWASEAVFALMRRTSSTMVVSASESPEEVCAVWRALLFPHKERTGSHRGNGDLWTLLCSGLDQSLWRCWIQRPLQSQ